MTRPFTHPAAKDITIDGLLYALSDKIRRDIMVKLMSCESMCCNEACADGLPPSTISFHHKILRETGLIKSVKEGVSVVNSARHVEIEKRFPGLLAAILNNHK